MDLLKVKFDNLHSVLKNKNQIPKEFLQNLSYLEYKIKQTSTAQNFMSPQEFSQTVEELHSKLDKLKYNINPYI